MAAESTRKESDEDSEHKFDCDFVSLFTNTTKKLADFAKDREMKLNKLLAVNTSDEPECDAAAKTIPTSKKRVKKSVVPLSESSPILLTDKDSPQPVRGRGRGRGRGRSSRVTRATKNTRQVDQEIPPPVFVSKPFFAMDLTLDDSVQDDSIDLEDENYEMSVKVCWRYKTVTSFKIRKYQKLSSVFEFYAKQEGVPQSRLQLILGDRIVSPDDTPESLALTIANILEGGIMPSTAPSGTAGAVVRAASPVDPDSIQLKIRAKDSKQPIMIRMKKTQKMSVLMTKYSEKTEVPVEKLKFSFDGDTIDPSETPEDLDLEGDEMIDLVIIAT